MNEPFDRNTADRTQHEGGCLASIFLMSWAGFIIFGGIAVVIGTLVVCVGTIAVLGYVLINAIIVGLGATTLCVLLAILLLFGIIGAVFESWPRR